MKRFVTALAMVSGLFGLLNFGGCTQLPTEKQSISDMRPQISFKTEDERVHSARVLIDGLDMGSVGDYRMETASLRILSGTHVLRVVMGNQIVLEEKFYVGDGVTRTFSIVR